MHDDEIIRCRARLKAALRVIAVLLGGVIALTAGLIYFLTRGSRPGEDPLTAALLDADVRRQAVSKLVDMAPNLFDTFPDPEVARVLQPDLRRREVGSLHFSSDHHGMREKTIATPKPKDELRVVLLGDSFIFGSGCEAEDRCGVFLESFLQERAQDLRGPLRCLHLGIVGWDIVAECSFLRRRISLLEPDLVIQVLVGNDLDDNMSVRGFGTMADFAVPHRENGFTLLGSQSNAAQGFEGRAMLFFGLDFEGRRRYRDAAAHLSRLSDRLRIFGSEYLALVTYWSGLLPVAREQLVHELAEDRVAYVPVGMRGERRFRVSETDPHWSRDGHERIGKLLYGLIRQRNLLPKLSLLPWEEADQLVEELHGKGLVESQDPEVVKRRIKDLRIRRVIEFNRWNTVLSQQVHGGVDAEGNVSPYASILMPRGSALKVTGECFRRPEIDGTRVDVLIDEERVHSFTVEGGHKLEWQSPVPESLRELEYLSVRFKAGDHVYLGHDLRQCAVFQLKRIEMLP